MNNYMILKHGLSEGNNWVFVNDPLIQQGHILSVLPPN